MRTTKTLIVLLLCCFAVNVAAASPDPHLGTWKLNVAKSKYSPGPAPKEVTMKIEAKGAGIHLTQTACAARSWASRARISTSRLRSCARSS